MHDRVVVEDADPPSLDFGEHDVLQMLSPDMFSFDVVEAMPDDLYVVVVRDSVRDIDAFLDLGQVLRPRDGGQDVNDHLRLRYPFGFQETPNSSISTSACQSFLFSPRKFSTARWASIPIVSSITM